MKNILLVLSLFLSINAFSQDDVYYSEDTTKVVVNNTYVTNNNWVQVKPPVQVFDPYLYASGYYTWPSVGSAGYYYNQGYSQPVNIYGYYGRRSYGSCKHR